MAKKNYPLEVETLAHELSGQIFALMDLAYQLRIIADAIGRQGKAARASKTKPKPSKRKRRGKRRG